MAANIPTFLQSLFACGFGTCGLWNIEQAGGVNNSSQEGGIDVTARPGTPVYALASGPIVGSGYFCHGGPFNLSSNDSNCNSGYGVVTIRSSVPGHGTQDIYYQHIMIDQSIPICSSGNGCTGYVQKGQQIGTVSAAGETEIGANANWDQFGEQIIRLPGQPRQMYSYEQ